MLKITKDILDNKTYKELQEICKDFDNRDFKNIDEKNHNFYVRLFIKKEMLMDYITNAKKYLIENLSYDKTNTVDFEDSISWINKISTESNKDDDFHFDTSVLTLITYLNDEYTGGEFIYIDENGNEKTIVPKPNMTLIMDNHLFHKVANVNSGIRFSLITFLILKQKKNKSLI